MDKIKKEVTLIYLACNAIVTFFITMSAFVLDFMNYFNMTINRAIVKLFTDNIYTTLYFMLLWILNYLIFEIYKIFIEGLAERKKYILRLKINKKLSIAYDLIVLFLVLIFLIIIKMDDLFKINFVLLDLFMIIKAVKEEIKYHKNRLV